MAKGNSTGCIGVVVGLILVIGLLGIAGFFYFFKAKAVDHRAVAGPEADGTNALVFQEGSMPRLPFPKPGETLSREQFVTFMIDQDATALSKETFRKIANQAKVRWELRTQEISDQDSFLVGDFDLPWEVHHNHGSRGSAVQVRAEFTEESRAALLQLRRGDWATVEGELSMDNDTPCIKNARLATEGN